MEKECINCKSFEPTIYLHRCREPNRKVTDGLCLKDMELHDADDCCDKFETKWQE
ncbi:MAG: hypothetical protein JW837_15950 [Sedimentisphaerales bacterium]|nr:hypothetical protein [Sedimentisphaerales bacterium]